MTGTVVTPVRSPSVVETQKMAAAFAQTLKPGAVVALFGDLGAGKTTFVQGMARGLGIPPEYYVNSPTFTLVNIYEKPGGGAPLYHVDLYRIGCPEEIEGLDLEELMGGEGITVIEWAEKWPELKRLPHYTVTLMWTGEEQREITIVPPAEAS